MMRSWRRFEPGSSRMPVRAAARTAAADASASAASRSLITQRAPSRLSQLPASFLRFDGVGRGEVFRHGQQLAADVCSSGSVTSKQG